MIIGLHTILNAKRNSKLSITGYYEISQFDTAGKGQPSEQGNDDVYANEGRGMTIW